MAKSPDKPRDPAKHSKKAPARPTRSKAHRPDSAPTDPALEKLLNPGIEKGTAGMGSGTGLQPPPDNSFDRRSDFSAAHRARKSTLKTGFEEAPQRGYVARAPLEINGELANALGYGQGDPNRTLIGDTPEQRDEISDISEPRREKRVMHRPSPQPITLGVTASMEALDKLL